MDRHRLEPVAKQNTINNYLVTSLFLGTVSKLISETCKFELPTMNTTIQEHEVSITSFLPTGIRVEILIHFISKCPHKQNYF